MLNRLLLSFSLPLLRLPKKISVRSIKSSDCRGVLTLFVAEPMSLPPLRLGKSFGFWCGYPSDFRLGIFPPFGYLSVTFVSSAIAAEKAVCPLMLISSDCSFKVFPPANWSTLPMLVFWAADEFPICRCWWCLSSLEVVEVVLSTLNKWYTWPFLLGWPFQLV